VECKSETRYTGCLTLIASTRPSRGLRSPFSMNSTGAWFSSCLFGALRKIGHSSCYRRRVPGLLAKSGTRGEVRAASCSHRDVCEHSGPSSRWPQRSLRPAIESRSRYAMRQAVQTARIEEGGIGTHERRGGRHLCHLYNHINILLLVSPRYRSSGWSF